MSKGLIYHFFLLFAGYIPPTALRGREIDNGLDMQSLDTGNFETASSEMNAPMACPASSANYDYDLFVIGSRPVGQRAAIQAANLGKRVAVAEMKH